MSAEHIYRVSNGGWVHCDGHHAQDVPAWPRLTHTALVVLDLDDVFTDVWRFEGKAEYAAALIEKRVRTQGLVDGTAHIVLHKVVTVPGGFQAFFSALSLELWQRSTQWAQEQSDHCLVMLSGGLLCHGVRPGNARVLLSQRRLMLFAHTEEGMVFGAAQGLGAGASAVTSAAQVLTANHTALLTRLGPDVVEWGVLWTSHLADAQACQQVLQGALGGAPAVIDAKELDLAGERVHTALPMLARAAAGKHALNPVAERVAWRAERWVAGLTAVTALAGVTLMLVGVLVGQMADQQRVEGNSQRAELAALQNRIQAVTTVDAPQKLLPVAEFSRTLDEGALHDPVAFLAVLKAASGKDIRIQRVRLERVAQTRAQAFRVDGVAAPGATASVTRWVNQMTAAGWKLKALDPALTQPGAFSYELAAQVPTSENVKP